MAAGPVPNDVLIVSREGRHFVSVFPERAQVSFSSLSQAREFAERWVKQHPGTSVWHQHHDTMDLMAVAELPKPPAA